MASNKNFVIRHNQNFYRIFLRSGYEVMQVIVPNDMDFGMDASLMNDLVKAYEKRLRRQY